MNEPETALSQALAAYAGVTSGELLDARRVRARILQSARSPRRRLPLRLSLVLPLVATFAASAALAASQPALRSAIAVHWHTLLGPAPAAPKHARAWPLPRPAEPVAAPTPVAPGLENGSSSQPTAPIAIDALPLAAPAATPDSARTDEKGLAPAPASNVPSTADPELEAYRAAHRTHFDSGAPAAALAAWDHYLAAFPSGSFADDARFNRALCLIRLGRLTQARGALVPFAGRPRGSYRQAEAASLLQGLRPSERSLK